MIYFELPSAHYGNVNEEITTKRILVTGGAGFLGSHLRDRLIKGGHDVLCMDNFKIAAIANYVQIQADG